MLSRWLSLRSSTARRAAATDGPLCGPCSAILMRVSLSRSLASRRPSNVSNTALEPSGRSTDGSRPEVLASDEHVVALATTRGQRGGKTIQHGQYSHVCHFRDGKLTEAWIVDVDPYEIDEFFG